MSIDPDRIRVDLLKAKRKVFLSFSPGSDEQKQFLIMSKLSELGYLSKLASSDVSGQVIDEYEILIKREISDISLSICIGLIFSALLFVFHLLISGSIYLNVAWMVPLFFSFFTLCRHGFHIYEAYTKIAPFKKEYKALQDKIKNVTKDLHELE